MVPSNASDFANNDPKTLTSDFVNPPGPDSIGNYYIKGEVILMTSILDGTLQPQKEILYLAWYNFDLNKL